jgi:hypothetical protein
MVWLVWVRVLMRYILKRLQINEFISVLNLVASGVDFFIMPVSFLSQAKTLLLLGIPPWLICPLFSQREVEPLCAETSK